MTADAANEGRDEAAQQTTEHGSEPGATPHTLASTTHTEPAAGGSDWTASDRRGPLVAADDEDVERVVPGSEMDAEGTPDETRPLTPRDGTHAAAEEGEPEAVRGETAAERANDRELGSTPVAAQQPVAQRRSGRSGLALVSGLVLGAIIGGGSAALVYTQAPHVFSQNNNGQLGSLQSRVDALEKRPDPQAELGDLRKQVADLGGKVSTLENRKAPSVPGGQTAAAPGADNAALDAKLATLQAQVAALGKASPATSGGSGQNGTTAADVAGARSAAAAATSSVAALTGREKDLEGKFGSIQAAASGAQAQVDTVKTKQADLEQKLDALQSTVAAAQKAAASAQSGLGTVQSAQKNLEGRVGAPALAVVADSLVEQIEAGKPYDKQVEALGVLNADPAKVAVLKQEASAGVPSAQTLLAKFKPLADPIIGTGSKEPHDASFAQQLKHGLFGLVSVRRTDQTTGTDLPSRVARIEADLAQNNVSDAYATWSALPANAKQVSQNWGALAKTSVEAISAARDLRGDAIGALGTKRS